MKLEEIYEVVDFLKRQLDGLQPLSAEVQEKTDKKFRLDWNYNSNHIEGNTLTYGETELLLLFDKISEEASKRDYREYEEMKAHDVALKMIIEMANDNSRPLTESFIRELNKIILVRPFWKDAITSDGNPTRKQIAVGEYKTTLNNVRTATGDIFHFATVEETKPRMQKLVDDFHNQADVIHPLRLAAKFHYDFVRIHPFDDGNGRISRLLMNYILLKKGFPPVIVQSKDKKNYLTALNRADTGDLDAFVEYIGQQLIRSLELYVKAAQGGSIEEEDDLEKEIALLKKTLDYKENEIVKSDDILRGLWSNSLHSLFIDFHKLINKFKDLFNGPSNEEIRIEGSKHMRLQNVQELDQFFKSGGELNVMKRIVFGITYHDMKRSGVDMAIHISVHFTDVSYTIDFSKTMGRGISRFYGFYVNRSDIESKLNEMGKTFLSEINKRV